MPNLESHVREIQKQFGFGISDCGFRVAQKGASPRFLCGSLRLRRLTDDLANSPAERNPFLRNTKSAIRNPKSELPLRGLSLSPILLLE
jgi:hypothetical protein